MSSLYTIAHVDFGDALKGIAAMAQRNVLAPALKKLKAPMRLDQKEHARAKAGPEGGWSPRATSSEARRRNLPKRPSKLLGRLPTAVSYKLEGTTLVGESRVAWSGVHQAGGTVGHGARLPARPFLWISDKFLGVAVETLGSTVAAAFGGA